MINWLTLSLSLRTRDGGLTNIVMGIRLHNFILKVLHINFWHIMLLYDNTGGKIIGNIVHLGFFENEKVWTPETLQKAFVSHELHVMISDWSITYCYSDI